MSKKKKTNKRGQGAPGGTAAMLGKKAGKKRPQGGFSALTTGQQVASGAALLAAVGLGYWAQGRRRPSVPAAMTDAGGPLAASVRQSAAG